MIYWTFHIINKSSRTYDSLYFGLYMDLDIGNLSAVSRSGVTITPRSTGTGSFVTFSDVKGYSREWLTQSGGNSPTGYME